MNTTRLSAVEWHPSGPYEYTVLYYGILVGHVGRYPREKTWYLKNQGQNVYASGLKSRQEATLQLLSVPVIKNLLGA